MSSDEDSDVLPSADEGEQENFNRQSSEDGDSSSEEGGDDDGFFDDTMDPLEFLEGMEHNDQAFELLRHRRHHQPEEEDEEDDDEDEIDENAMEVEPSPIPSASTAAAPTAHTTRQQDRPRNDSRQTTAAGRPPHPADAPTTTTDQDDDNDDDLMGHPEVKDTWNDALAERMGLAPVLNRRKARNREKWRRRSLKKGTRRKDMPEEAARKLGEANLLYATQRYQEAIGLLMDVVRLAPSNPDAYTSLGLLYETMGNNKKALNFYMFAAHLAPKDVEQWKRLWQLSIDQGLVRQAIYSLTQVIKREREDWEYRFERAVLYAEVGEYRKAIQGIEQVRNARPENPDAVKQLARLYFRAGSVDKAEEVLTSFMDAYPESTDLTHVNLLAELMCSPGMEKWEKILDLLDYTHKNILPAEEDMPLELSIKGAMAMARLGRITEALEGVQPLLQQDIDLFNDIYTFVATGLDDIGEYDAAEPFYKALALDPTFATPSMWHKLVECHKKSCLLHHQQVQLQHLGHAGNEGIEAAAAARMQQAEMSAAVAEDVARSTVEIWREIADHVQTGHPHYVEALLCLADALRRSGDELAAADVLGRLDPSFVQSDAGENPMTDMVETEVELLHRAHVLKACGRMDLMVDLALPSIAATLATWQSADSAAEARRLRRRRHGTHADGSSLFASVAAATAAGHDDIMDVNGNANEAVFVGYVSDQRRRQRRRAAAKAAKSIARRAAAEAEPEGDAMDEDEGEEDGGDPGRSQRQSRQAHGAIEARLGGVVFRAPTIPGLLKDDQAFQLMIDTILGLMRAGRSEEAVQVAQTAIDILGKRFPNKKKRDTVRLLAAEAYLEQDDVANALKHMKAPAVRWPATSFVWNVFCKLQLVAGGIRHSVKFLGPLRQKNPGSLPLALMSGHSHVHVAAYGTALSEYFQAYRAASKEPLVLLCIAAALLNIAASKYAPDRNATVLQAFAFLAEYSRLREEPGEAAYNMARAAHQLELVSLAVSFYEKTLALGERPNYPVDGSGSGGGGGGGGGVRRSAVKVGVLSGRENSRGGGGGGDEEEKEDEYSDCSAKYTVVPEAAFNLSLIFKNSGAVSLAKDVLRTHLTF